MCQLIDLCSMFWCRDVALYSSRVVQISLVQQVRMESCWGKDLCPLWWLAEPCRYQHPRNVIIHCYQFAQRDEIVCATDTTVVIRGRTKPWTIIRFLQMVLQNSVDDQSTFGGKAPSCLVAKTVTSVDEAKKAEKEGVDILFLETYAVFTLSSCKVAQTCRTRVVYFALTAYASCAYW